jgi:transglutaminase-like putative cysteine protease
MVRQRAATASIHRFHQFSLLGLVASGFLAVAGSGYLDLPTTILMSAALLWRGLAIGGAVRPGMYARAALPLGVLAAAWFPLDYFLISRAFIPSAIHLVFLLAIIRILTARTARDDVFTAAIAFVELLAAAVLSIDFNFFVFLALFLLFAIAALTSGEIRRSAARVPSPARAPVRRLQLRLAALTVAIAGGILVLTAGLFFLLPRTADAALARLVSHRLFVPGFSNQITLGDTGRIATSSRPVMHVRIWRLDTPGGLKWRGGVLSSFDGRRWSDPDARPERILVEDGRVALAQPGRSGRHIDYDVQLEPLESDALFFAGAPERVELPAPMLFRTESGVYSLERAPSRGFRYSAYSRLEDPPEAAMFQEPPVLRLAERERNLEKPRLDPRIAELARAMTAGAATDLERARAIERRLRADYAYTLDMPESESADPLAEFLFTRKRGYCEYFASAMAVMLRTVGIPARLATGFQSGVYNPITELWLVRASDAHSWVEAWIPGLGWTTFDPTPPSAAGERFGLFAQLNLYLDATRTFWQEWVLSYDMGRQGTLADRMEQGAQRAGIHWFDVLASARIDWDGYVIAPFRRYGPALLVALLVAAALWLGAPRLLRLLEVRRRVERARRGQADASDATLLYRSMLEALRRRGYYKPAWFTPAEFAASLPAGPLGATVAEFTIAYNELRFGGRTEAAPRLSALLEELQRRGRR